mgnify:CR=1 FL=1
MESKGTIIRSLDYVLGVEDCATMVLDYLKVNEDIQELRKEVEELLNDTQAMRSQLFMEENGLMG